MIRTSVSPSNHRRTGATRPQDFDEVEKEYGPLPPNASQAALDERYRLAQAAKVIRQLGQVVIGIKPKNRKPK